jgi:hypothetical protein
MAEFGLVLKTRTQKGKKQARYGTRSPLFCFSELEAPVGPQNDKTIVIDVTTEAHDALQLFTLHVSP